MESTARQFSLKCNMLLVRAMGVKIFMKKKWHYGCPKFLLRVQIIVKFAILHCVCIESKVRITEFQPRIIFIYFSDAGIVAKILRSLLK